MKTPEPWKKAIERVIRASTFSFGFYTLGLAHGDAVCGLPTGVQSDPGEDMALQGMHGIDARTCFRGLNGLLWYT